MAILGSLLLIIGVIGLIAGGLWFLVVAFQEHVLWGLGCIFVPFVSLVFLVMHWDRAWRPFVVQLVSMIPLIVGSIMADAPIAA